MFLYAMDAIKSANLLLCCLIYENVESFPITGKITIIILPSVKIFSSQISTQTQKHTLSLSLFRCTNIEKFRYSAYLFSKSIIESQAEFINKNFGVHSICMQRNGLSL